jgi:hypothetical protein
MTKTEEKLRTVGIYNAHGVLTKYAEATGAAVPPAITYQTQELGRMFRCASWRVIRPGFETDPNAHWQDHKQKTFAAVYPQTDKAPKLEEAKAWATARYGITEWVTIPGLRDTRFPIEVAAWVKQQLKKR